MIISDNGGRSFPNIRGSIAESLAQRWDPDGLATAVTIIDDWGSHGFMGERYRVHVDDGLSAAYDPVKWAARGVVLPLGDE